MTLYYLEIFIIEGILGYYLQLGSCVLGICAVAKKRVSPLPFIITSIILAGATYAIRTYSGFTFGIHTMIMLLLENFLCVLILKIDVRPAILGSLLSTIMVLVGEFLDFGILLCFYNTTQIQQQMADPLFKTMTAVPGNVLLCVVAIIAYVKRAVKGKG